MSRSRLRLADLVPTPTPTKDHIGLKTGANVISIARFFEDDTHAFSRYKRQDNRYVDGSSRLSTCDGLEGIAI